jgi:hypothetical protein
VLRTRFARERDVADLNRAIGLMELVVALTELNSPNRSDIEKSLGSVFRERYEVTENLSDLQRANQLGA